MLAIVGAHHLVGFLIQCHRIEGWHSASRQHRPIVVVAAIDNCAYWYQPITDRPPVHCELKSHFALSRSLGLRCGQICSAAVLGLLASACARASSSQRRTICSSAHARIRKAFSDTGISFLAPPAHGFPKSQSSLPRSRQGMPRSSRVDKEESSPTFATPDDFASKLLATLPVANRT